MLTLTKPQPRWLELPHGVRVEVEPLTTALATAARNDAMQIVQALRREEEARAAAGQPSDPSGWNGANPAFLVGVGMQKEIETLACIGIRRWEGVGGDDGQPLPVTPETCKLFAAHKEMGPAFYDAYMAPIRAVSAEGEGSRPSSGSGGAGAENIAPDATAAPEARTESPPAAADPVPKS